VQQSDGADEQMQGRARQALDARLTEFGNAVERHLRSQVGPGLPDDLAGMLRYHLGWVDERFEPTNAPRGKLLRPAVCLLVCEAAGMDWHAALPSAAAVELIHNFSLVHDDIEDGSPLRRHRPTLWAVWGVPRALNAGDSLLILAQLTVLFGDEHEGRALAAARILNKACQDLCAGQHRDLSAAVDAEPTLADYLAMVDGKTGALLEAAASLGAVAANAPLPVRQAYGRFGRKLGIAFQLQDDLLDVWGDAAATGKPAREDLHARKHSLPFVLACERAPAVTRARLRRLYAAPHPVDQATVEELVVIMEQLGVREEAERLVRYHHEAALAALQEARPAREGGALLAQLAAGLIGRQA
jgi:geranylgeranyl diphosphate synthase, type I